MMTESSEADKILILRSRRSRCLEEMIPLVDSKQQDHAALRRPLEDGDRAAVDRSVVRGCAKRWRQPALEAVRDGRDRASCRKNWEKTYFNWLDNIEPWCISRQLWWGHQVPVWYTSQI